MPKRLSKDNGFQFGVALLVGSGLAAIVAVVPVPGPEDLTPFSGTIEQIHRGSSAPWTSPQLHTLAPRA